MNAKKKADTDDQIIRIDGVEVRIPSPPEVSRMEAEKLPGTILLFGKILAAAEEQQMLIDAEYRQWRAIYTSGLIERDRRITEWRTRNRIETEPEFLKFKTGLAVALKHVLILRAVIDSLQARMTLSGRA